MQVFASFIVLAGAALYADTDLDNSADDANDVQLECKATSGADSCARPGASEHRLAKAIAEHDAGPGSVAAEGRLGAKGPCSKEVNAAVVKFLDSYAAEDSRYSTDLRTEIKLKGGSRELLSAVAKRAAQLGKRGVKDRTRIEEETLSERGTYYLHTDGDYDDQRNPYRNPNAIKIRLDEPYEILYGQYLMLFEKQPESDTLIIKIDAVMPESETKQRRMLGPEQWKRFIRRRAEEMQVAIINGADQEIRNRIWNWIKEAKVIEIHRMDIHNRITNSLIDAYIADQKWTPGDQACLKHLLLGTPNVQNTENLRLMFNLFLGYMKIGAFPTEDRERLFQPADAREIDEKKGPLRPFREDDIEVRGSTELVILLRQ